MGVCSHRFPHLRIFTEATGGENLFANSILALDAAPVSASGIIKAEPNDVWDYITPCAPTLWIFPWIGEIVQALYNPQQNGKS